MIDSIINGRLALQSPFYYTVESSQFCNYTIVESNQGRDSNKIKVMKSDYANVWVIINQSQDCIWTTP